MDWPRFAEIVRSEERFLLTSHVRPDCDGLGSELGMAGVLQQCGKHVIIVNGDDVPPHLAFIDPGRKIKVLGKDVSKDALDAIHVILVLDTASWAQLGPMAEILRHSRARKVVIDHHGSADELGAETFTDPRADSTGRLVLEAADALGAALSPEIAIPLFVAITTDTGWFRFSSVTGDTFRAVAKLVDAGVRPDAVYADLYERNTLARLWLRGRILASAKSQLDGRLLIAAATRSDFEVTGAQRSDTEDVVNMLLSVAGSEVAVLLVEQGHGRIKASLRSRSPINVRHLAERFGGGGHAAAAGAMLEGPLNKAEANLLDELRNVMQRPASREELP
jgi:phosphoesterase RecJ-like protein